MLSGKIIRLQPPVALYALCGPDLPGVSLILHLTSRLAAYIMISCRFRNTNRPDLSYVVSVPFDIEIPMIFAAQLLLICRIWNPFWSVFSPRKM